MNRLYRTQSWERYVENIANGWKGEDLRQLLSKISRGDGVYAIWRERINRCFASSFQTKERIFDNIRRMIRDKEAELTNIKLNHNSAYFAKKWGLLPGKYMGIG